MHENLEVLEIWPYPTTDCGVSCPCVPEKMGKHFFSAIVDQTLFIFFSRFCLFCAFTRPRYQVSVYRTIGPLVLWLIDVSSFVIIAFT